MSSTHGLSWGPAFRTPAIFCNPRGDRPLSHPFSNICLLADLGREAGSFPLPWSSSSWC